MNTPKWMNGSALTALIAIHAAFLLVMLFGILSSTGEVAHTISWGSVGDLVAGAMAIPGVIYLIRTFSLQRSEKHEAELHDHFKLRCESIDIGLSYIRNRDGTSTGADAIFRYSELCTKNWNLNQVLNELDPSAMNALIAAIIEVEKWLMQDKAHMKFHPIFRVRYTSLVIALSNMLPEKFENWQQSFKYYMNPNLGYSQERAQLLHQISVGLIWVNKYEFDAWCVVTEAEEEA